MNFLIYGAGAIGGYLGGMLALRGHEVAFITTGRQLRIRVPPTADRQKLKEAVAVFSSDEGANAFLDSLLEADRRFLRPVPLQWPVFMILTTDGGGTLREPHIDEFNPFVAAFIGRGGAAHAIMIQGKNTGITTELVMTLAGNAGGMRETMVISTAVADRMHAAAQRMAADHRTMATRYEVEYQSEGRPDAKIEVETARAGATLVLSQSRPF